MASDDWLDVRPLHIPSTAEVVPEYWTWIRLDELCLGIFDCPHSTPKLTAFGPFLARSQDIRSGIFRTDEAAHVSEQTYLERTARSIPVYGDLLYSREGTYFGIAAEIPRDIEACLGQRMVLIRPDPERLNFRFLRFWLNSPVLSRHVFGQRDGTVAERLNLPTIRAIPVPLPPLSEQRAIARVLGALDDKIELNRRTNETLEAMARALVQLMRQNVSIDWTIREAVRAHLRVQVRRLLRKYGYPPDRQEKATQTVIEQAELLCKDWAA